MRFLKDYFDRGQRKSERVQLQSTTEFSEIHRVRRNFKKKVCIRFVPRGPGDDSVCACGLTFDQHEVHHGDEPDGPVLQKGNHGDEPWSAERDTHEEDTDAYGLINFGLDSPSFAKFVRVQYDLPDLTTLVDLLLNTWELRRPKLIISVTGGAKDFNLEKGLKVAFRRGLVKAAVTTGAWLTTGGTYTGVMKHVGKAVQEYTEANGPNSDLVLLGVATWSCIQQRHLLQNLVDTEDSEYYDQVADIPVTYDAKSFPPVQHEAPLDPNHTHFVLVDDGTCHRYGGEIHLRTKLEATLSLRARVSRSSASCSRGRLSHSSLASRPVPVVCVAVEGGPGTLETIQSSLELGTPVVLIQGSGRITDLLAEAINLHESTRDLEELLKTKLKEYGDQCYFKMRQWIRYCLDKKEMLSVFNLDKDGSVDWAILQAILKTPKYDNAEKLRLAQQWHRTDIAVDYIHRNAKISIRDYEDIYRLALKKNQLDLVRLFLHTGVISLRECVDYDTLIDLYTHILTARRYNPLKSALKKVAMDTKYHVVQLDDIGRLLGRLLGIPYPVVYDKVESGSLQNLPNMETAETNIETAETVPGLSVPVARRQFSSDTVDMMSVNSQLDTAVRLGIQSPYVHLFFWSILANKRHMAMLFWERCKEQVALALVAQKILISLQRYTIDSDRQALLHDNAIYFGTLAVDCLSHLYQNNEDQCRRLLIAETTTFGGRTVLELAVRAHNQQLVAHPASQSLIQHIWVSPIPHGTAFPKTVLALLLPMFASRILGIEREESVTAAVVVDPEVSSNGISEDEWQESFRSRGSSYRRSFGHVTDTIRSRMFGGFKKSKRQFHLCDFYKAPLCKFFYASITHLVFVVMFSISLTSFFNKNFTNIDAVLIFWVTTLLLEEVRQMLTDEVGRWRKSIWNYFRDVWNILDVVSALTFFLAMALRFSPCSRCLFWGRVVGSLANFGYIVRILDVFSVSKTLGPKIVMIGHMMVDLFVYLAVLLVFVLGFGVLIQAVRYPDHPLGVALFKEILRRPYFQIYGEFFLEDLEGGICQRINGTQVDPRCDESSTYVLPFFLGLYILITNVLVLNLIIAMFGLTVSTIHEKTNEVWRMQRYHVIREFYDRPILPPPLIVIEHLFRCIKYCVLRCCDRRDKNKFRLQLNQKERKTLQSWEALNIDDFLRIRKESTPDGDIIHRPTSDDKDTTALETCRRLNNRLKHIENKLQYIFEQQRQKKSEALFRSSTFQNELKAKVFSRKNAYADIRKRHNSDSEEDSSN